MLLGPTDNWGVISDAAGSSGDIGGRAGRHRGGGHRDEIGWEDLGPGYDFPGLGGAGPVEAGIRIASVLDQLQADGVADTCA